MSETESNRRFAEEFVAESADIAHARQHSIEIGTGVGVSGLWFFAGAPTALLTTIDIEAEHQQAARKNFADAGVPGNRVRLITGRALDVLPRMNESPYDIVLIDADPAKVIEYAEHGLRLVRPGGTVLVTHALWQGRVADPTKRDETTVGYRTLLKEIAGSDAVISSLSPLGDGLLQITMRP